MDAQALLDLLKQHQELVYGLLLFLWSEILGMNPRWQANSVMQLILNCLRERAKPPTTPPVLLVLGALLALTGCGKTLDQLRTTAHNIIDVAEAVYADAKDDVKTAQETVTAPFKPTVPVVASTPPVDVQVVRCYRLDNEIRCDEPRHDKQ